MEIKQLYREIVNEHNLHPSHKRNLDNPTMVLQGINPSCGDDINLQLKVKDGIIEDAAFNGSGCAISQASTDMMIDLIIGQTKEEALKLAGTFMGMIKGETTEEEIAYMIAAVTAVVAYLSGFSPVWHDLLDGKTKYVL